MRTPVTTIRPAPRAPARVPQPPGTGKDAVVHRPIDLRTGRGRGLLVLLAVAAAVLLGAVPRAGAEPDPGGFDPLDPGPLFATVDRYEPDSMRQALTLYAYANIGHLDIEGVPGHEVVVLGDAGEPYLRIAADGTTSVNDASPTAANDRSTVVGPVAPTTAPTTGPVWRATGTTHHLSWSDRRVRWVQPTAPTTAPGGDVVQDFTVQVLVDGRPGSVHGQLHRDPTIPWDRYGIAVAPPGPGDEIAPADQAPPGRSLLPLVAVGAGLLVALAVGIVLVRRRRSHPPPPRSGGSRSAGSRSGGSRSDGSRSRRSGPTAPRSSRPRR